MEELESMIADPDMYADPERAREVVEEHDSLGSAIEDLYSRWSDVCEQRESLE